MKKLNQSQTNEAFGTFLKVKPKKKNTQKEKPLSLQKELAKIFSAAGKAR